MSQREDILDLLYGKKMNSQPSFSGLIHVTAEGLQSEGLVFHEIHKDAHKMARAAMSTYQLSGLPSAVLPLDLYVEAEALGAEINFRENAEFEFPQVRKAGFDSVKILAAKMNSARSLMNEGRIRLVCEAITLLKKDIGSEVVIGGMIPGPYTLLLLVVDTGKMFIEMKKEPQAVTDALLRLASFLAEVGLAYRNAGADFITIHDMGGSPAFIGPARYEQFVLPSEKSLIERLPKPRILSVCGNVTACLSLLANTDAEAVSLDQTVALSTARMALKGRLLFGNLDPVETLFKGDPQRVREAVILARQAGADAIWPGCDLVIKTPIENLKSLADLSVP